VPDPLQDADRPLTFLEHGPRTVDPMRLRVLAVTLATTAVLATGCGASSTPSPAAPSASPAPSAPPSASGQAGRHGVRGTITAEDGSTWTVTTAANRRFTVTVNPQTAFGTRKAPATAQAFPVGAQVRVAGTVSGTAVTATRIVAADAAKPPTPAASAPPATPTAATI
jgi:Domain of unknown function (DUF5666)